MARVKLRKVAALAVRDAKFFKELRADPDAALSRVRMQLSVADRKTLQVYLSPGKRQADIDAVRLIKWAQSQVAPESGRDAPSEDWEIDWGSEWVYPERR